MARKKKNRQNAEAPQTPSLPAQAKVEQKPSIPSGLESHPYINQFFLLLLVGLSLLIYGRTMWPTVGGGDAGELIAASYTLGIIHPPGYPLFIWLGKILSYMPFGTVAWRIGWVSVLSSVASIALFYLIVRELTHRPILAFISSGLLAFSTLIWRYSIIAEVFTLNNLFVCWLIYLYLRFTQNPTLKSACIMAFVFGLGLSNHHTLVFLGLPMAAWMLWRYRDVLLLPKAIFLLPACGVLGLLPYLHLVWASAQIPLVSWGDATTWEGFLTHFLRREYGTLQLASDGSQKLQLFHGLLYYVQSLAEHALYIGILFVGFGIFVSFKRETGVQKQNLLLLLFCGLFYLITFHYLANLPYVEGAALYKDIVSRFWLMGHIFFFIFMAVGVSELLKQSPIDPRVVLMIGCLAILLQIGLNYSNENQRNNWTFDRFGRSLLAPVPKDALFFTLGDINTNTVRYLQNCENFRKDVKVLDRSLMSYGWFKRIIQKHYPDVNLPGVAYHPQHPRGFNFDKVFAANIDRMPVWVTFIKTSGALESSDLSMDKRWKTVPYGLSLKVKRFDEDLNIEEYVTESSKYILDPFKEFEELPPRESWDAVVKSNYWLGNHMRAAEILRWAMDHNFDQKYLRLAADLLGDLILRNPSPPPDYYKNHGIAHHHLARLGPANEKADHEMQMIKSWQIYISKTERRDKLYQDIVSILRSYGLKSAN